MTLSPILQRKLFMIAYLCAIIAAAAWVARDARSVWTVLATVGLYAGTDLAWTWVRDRRRYLPLSSLISGLILGILLAPTTPLAVRMVAPLLAVASKQLLRIRQRHVFNPAAFSATVLSFGSLAAVSWWAVAAWPPSVVLLVGVPVGAFIVHRVRRWPVVVPFLAVYTVGIALTVVSHTLDPRAALSAVRAALVDGTLIFFVTIMLIEPVTTAYRTWRIQAAYGAAVGLFAVVLPVLGLGLPDGLLPPLLLGNLLAAFWDRYRPTRRAKVSSGAPLVVPFSS